MRTAELTAETLEKIKSRRYDRIIEKHEGPESWESIFRYAEPEFLRVQGFDVLLPIEERRHPNVTILRVIVADDRAALTIFLKDTTFVQNPEDERFMAGFLAVCERAPGEQFYVASVYHEWFIIRPDEQRQIT
jgi:hypothetical protein